MNQVKAPSGFVTRLSVVIILGTAGATLAQNVTEITLPGARVGRACKISC